MLDALAEPSAQLVCWRNGLRLGKVMKRDEAGNPALVPFIRMSVYWLVKLPILLVMTFCTKKRVSYWLFSCRQASPHLFVYLSVSL